MRRPINPTLQTALSKHILRDVDLANLFEGSPARRYGLVNKALKKKELLKVRRGLYLLPSPYFNAPVSLYYLANHIVPFSFVTAESALSFHGWIPERVFQVISLTPFGRKREFKTPFGIFCYYTTSVKTKNFLRGVQRVQIGDHTVWMATPLRALLDYLYLHNLKNIDLKFLEQSLRIDEIHLKTLKKKSLHLLKSIYPTKNIVSFLNTLGEKNDNKRNH